MDMIQARKKFKELTETFIEEVYDMESIEELMKKQIQSKKNIKVISKAKNENTDISELKEIVKKHRDKAYEVSDFEMDANKYTVSQILNMVKGYKEDVDLEIEDDILNLKSLNEGFANQIKQYKQQVALIDIIIEKRVNV
jgi:phosphotransferase system HPr-like phosphotransfer protein